MVCPLGCLYFVKSLSLSIMKCYRILACSCIDHKIALVVTSKIPFLSHCKVNIAHLQSGEICFVFLQAGKYDESLKHLEALQELNKEDYKISMNKAIVKFFKSGQTTTGTLKQSLMAMRNQVTAETWTRISC